MGAPMTIAELYAEVERLVPADTYITVDATVHRHSGQRVSVTWTVYAATHGLFTSSTADGALVLLQAAVASAQPMPELGRVPVAEAPADDALSLSA